MTQRTTKPTNPRNYAPSMVATLRSLMPNRPLGFHEAKRIAELQAARLLSLTDSTSAPVSEAIITELPRLAVQRVANLIGSGATAWSRGRWQLRINAAEPATRQRFTLAHELKHVLDAAHEDIIYGHLPTGPAKERFVEAVCDHFAACLLMPKSWVKQLWGQGVQDLGELAWRFEVSQQAMLIRLQAIGLVEPLPRCAHWQRLGSVAVRSSGRSPSRDHRRTYRRSPSQAAVHRYGRSTCVSPVLPTLEGALP